MHTKPDLRVFLKWMIARSGSVITDVIPPYRNRSMIDNTYTEFVFCALRIAPVVVVVALIAFACRRRLFFAFGFAGCFAGLFFDRGGSTGGHLDHAATRADSFLVLGVIGATIGLSIAYAITMIRSRKPKPTIDNSNQSADSKHANGSAV